MNSKSIEDADDSVLAGSFKALQRAARRAREDALRTNTELILAQDGKIVRVSPSEIALQLRTMKSKHP